MLDGFLGGLFNQGFKLCGRCLANEEAPTVAEASAASAMGEEIAAAAKDAGKYTACLKCGQPLEEHEIIERDDAIQIALLALEPAVLRKAANHYMEYKKELWEKAIADAEKASKERAEKRAQEEAAGAEKEKTDETT